MSLILAVYLCLFAYVAQAYGRDLLESYRSKRLRKPYELPTGSLQPVERDASFKVPSRSHEIIWPNWAVGTYSMRQNGMWLRNKEGGKENAESNAVALLSNIVSSIPVQSDDECELSPWASSSEVSAIWPEPIRFSVVQTKRNQQVYLEEFREPINEEEL